MKILISQPSSLYYAWQTEVFLENLLEHNFNLNDVEIVCSGNRSYEWNKLAMKYAARFFFYPFTAKSNYPSISRPNSLAAHFRQFPELSNETILYMDCDCLPLVSPYIALGELLRDDIIYLSDTKWYTGYCYLKSKENQVSKNKEQYDTDKILQPLCEKIGISLQVVKDNDDHSGGAQYLLKGIDAAFWEEVEKDCHTIYNYFHYSIPGSINQTYFPNEVEGFQSFALGDMLGLLWNLKKRDKVTRIVPEMAFCWATDNIQAKEGKTFYHNAGVCSDNEGLFYKSKYFNQIPYFEDFSYVKPDSLSYLYTTMLSELREKTCLI